MFYEYNLTQALSRFHFIHEDKENSENNCYREVNSQTK